MTTDTFDPKKALLAAKIIYFAIISGSLFFLLVVFFIATEKFFFKINLSEPLFIALIFLTLIVIPGGLFSSGKLLNRTDITGTLAQKFPVYQIALIIRMASCEGVALFAVVCLLLTNNSFSLIFFIIAVFVMMGFYPTPEKIGKELNLGPSEIELF